MATTLVGATAGGYPGRKVDPYAGGMTHTYDCVISYTTVDANPPWIRVDGYTASVQADIAATADIDYGSKDASGNVQFQGKLVTNWNSPGQIQQIPQGTSYIRVPVTTLASGTLNVKVAIQSKAPQLPTVMMGGSSVVNVQNPGGGLAPAVPDGVTDNTAAIQAMIDSSQGKELYFPAGDYYIATHLTMKSKTVLTGPGPRSSRFLLQDIADGNLAGFVFPQLLQPPVQTTIAANVAEGATQVTVAAGQGANFPPGTFIRFNDNRAGNLANGALPVYMGRVAAQAGDLLTLEEPVPPGYSLDITKSPATWFLSPSVIYDGVEMCGFAVHVKGTTDYAPTATNRLYGLNTQCTHRLLLSDLEVWGPKINAILVGNAWRPRVENVLVGNCGNLTAIGGQGAANFGFTQHLQVRDLRVARSAVGLLLNGNVGGSVKGLKIAGTYPGVVATVPVPPTYGNGFYGYGIVMFALNGTTLTDFEVNGSPNAGLIMADCQNCLASNGLIQNCGTAGGARAELRYSAHIRGYQTGTSYRNSLLGVRLLKGAGEGLVLDGFTGSTGAPAEATRHTIEGCTISDVLGAPAGQGGMGGIALFTSENLVEANQLAFYGPNGQGKYGVYGAAGTTKNAVVGNTFNNPDGNAINTAASAGANEVYANATRGLTNALNTGGTPDRTTPL